jgi:PGF-CTERM protein
MMTPVVAMPGDVGPVDTADAAVAQDGPPNPCAGTVTESAEGTTVISVQGFQFGEGGGKQPAKLVGVGPNGEIRWVHQMAEKFDVRWGYDVDPLPNGTLFVTADLRSEQSIFYEFDPQTQEVVWAKRLDTADTHDADLINNGSEILVADMRNYNESAERNDDRIFVYDRTTEEIEWEWRFDDHYDRQNLEENYTDDWTHVNDVDKIGEGRYLASPRNFDQSIVVNRSTNEIDMKLGEDGEKDILNEQHNPDYLESENGTPTLIVGDSENNRIVEYANPDGGSENEGSSDSSDGDLADGDGWNRTWTLAGDLDWPRDADRLPSGNTLVTDSANNRVAEVTPEGEVVWEFYAPWLVYDAARIPAGEHGGPTATDLNATGSYEIHGGAKLHENQTRLNECHQTLENSSGLADGQSAGATNETDETSEGAMDDQTGENGSDAGQGDETEDPASTGMPGFGSLAALAGLLVALGIGVRRRR